MVRYKGYWCWEAAVVFVMLGTDELDEVMDGYDPVILRVDKDGNVTEEWLDENGSVVSHTWRDE